MRTVRVRHAETGTVVASRVRVADRWWTRLRGLLGRPEPGADEGMLLLPCRAVHMVGMRYPLDVAFVDREGRVVALYPGLAPGERTGHHAGALAALELRAGRLGERGVRIGSRLTWREDA